MGAAFLSPAVAHRVIQQVSGDRLASAARARALVAGLTPREREVLALIGGGLPNAEIGRSLHVVEGTVKVFVTSIPRRLEVANRVRAAIAEHLSFTDAQVLLPQLAGDHTAAIGTIDPPRGLAAQRRYLAAFFDPHLRGRPTTVFDRPAYPEVEPVA